VVPTQHSAVITIGNGGRLMFTYAVADASGGINYGIRQFALALICLCKEEKKSNGGTANRPSVFIVEIKCAYQ